MERTEKMRVLDLLDAGKITADEAAKLLEALGRPQFISRDTRDNLEERIGKFAAEVNAFAKEVGCKVQDLYKDVEPKIKKASQSALEKAAATLDGLANNINDSLDKGANGCCCEPECECEPVCECESDDNIPKPN